MSISFFYITSPNLAVSKKLARALLKKKIIACANIIPKMTSIYWWEGKLSQSQESILLVKTKSSQAKILQAWVTENHPYTTPCIAEIKISSVNKPYLDWLQCQIITNRMIKTKRAVKAPKVKKSLIV